MSQSHFFEGPEKKLEMVFNPDSSLNLLERPKAYWEALVRLSCAQILSEIQTEDCKAFLLSESSLFVWKHRVILITCGTTQLIRAADFLLKEFQGQIKDVFFERKNEYYPVLQKSTSVGDMQNLKKEIGGEAVRFGRTDDHHVYVFNKAFNDKKEQSVVTLEVLMYGLQGEFKNSFVGKPEHQKLVLKNLNQIFPDFKFDPYFFNPEGFSLNALNKDQYATIHVTPQGSENYLSFEMDQFEFEKDRGKIQSLINLCKPISYDIVLFSPDPMSSDLEFSGYSLKQESHAEVESGYFVNYKHYFDKKNTRIQPERF